MLFWALLATGQINMRKVDLADARLLTIVDTPPAPDALSGLGVSQCLNVSLEIVSIA
jgi:hypothetical protein